jgi:hypothetical protein
LKYIVEDNPGDNLTF